LLENKPIVYVLKLIFIFVTIVILFVIIGLMTTAKPSSRITSVFFTNWTSNLNEAVFSYLFSVENRHFALYQENMIEPFYHSKMPLQQFTNIRFTDFTSFIGKELPGFSTYEQNVIVASDENFELASLFHESGPPIEDILEEREAIEEAKEEIEEPSEKVKQDDISEKVVFLYNSHNRESFLPHLPKETNPNRAYHKDVNITKVSERLAEKLAHYQIGAEVDDTDFTTILHEKGWTYGKSYDASRTVVEAAVQNNKHLKYIFDLHRDSLPYDKTTINIDGHSYATILFVIGAENKQYEKNLALATELHYLINDKMPGLSRGVITKEGPKSNGVYNQDLLETALLIEIGGYDNHLDELYRTIDIFADIFSSYYWDAEQVSK
jgi:stage II sporulation protein P